MKTNLVLAVFEVELIDYVIDFNYIDTYKVYIPNSIRKLIPYRGYLASIEINKELIGIKICFMRFFSDKLLFYESTKQAKVNKQIFNQLNEIDKFIRNKKYKPGPISDFINYNFECASQYLNLKN